jgi:hypothetical protein
MKRFLVALTALLAIGTMPSSARAVCTRANHIVSSIALYPGAAATRIYFQSSPVSLLPIWYGDTTNVGFIALATAAAANKTTVTVVGSAASCPAAGNSRSIGTLTSLTAP